MITLTLTSDSSLRELEIAQSLIDDLIELRGNNPTHVIMDEIITSANTVCGHVKAEHLHNDFVDGAGVDPIFNATELAEAETLGKPVCSTVDAEASQTAQEDMTVNTSIPTPQSVFGQPVQPIENTVSHAVPLSELHAHDADGIKWDARIHSSSRELNKDGTWRKRRGVNTDLVTQVEAELRGTVSVVAEAYAEVTGKTIEQSIHELNNGGSVHSYNDGQIVAINPDGIETSGTRVLTFSELLDGVTKAMVAGELSQARINEALQSVGVQALPHLLGNTTLIPAFREALGGVV